MIVGIRVFLRALTRICNVAACRCTAGVQVFEWRQKVPEIVASRCQSTVLGTADPLTSRIRHARAAPQVK